MPINNCVKCKYNKSSIKRQRIAKWIKKKRLSYMLPKTSALRTHTDWKWRDGKNIPSKQKPKESSGYILKPDKIDFNSDCNKRQR